MSLKYIEDISLNLDYCGLRQLYEKNYENEKLEVLVLSYTKKVSLLDMEKVVAEGVKDPFLYGVVLSEEAIEKLSIHSLTVLILNGAKPLDKLLEKLSSLQADSYYFEYYDLLYRQCFIDVKDYQKIFSRAVHSIYRTYDSDLPLYLINMKKLFEKKDFTRYTDLDFSDMVFHLHAYINGKKTNMYDEVLVFLAINLISLAPYSDRHLELAHFMCGILKTAKLDFYETGFRKMFESLNEAQIIDLLYERPDLLYLVLKDQTSSQILEEYVNQDKLFDMLAKDEIGPVMLALRIFKDISIPKIRLLNMWIKNELELPIDIYLEAFLKDSLFDLNDSKSAKPDFCARTLDKKHIEAKKDLKKKYIISPIPMGEGDSKKGE